MQGSDSQTAEELIAVSRQLEVTRQYGALEDVLRRVVSLCPGVAEHALRWGWALLALDRLSEARDVFAGISGSPADRSAAACGGGIAAHRAGDATAAVRLLSAAVKAGITAANLPLVKAANDAGQFRKALEVTSRLAAQAPLDRDTVMLHARQLAYVGEFRSAADAILHLFSRKTADSESLELLCQTLVAAKDYEGASNALSQLLRIDFERSEMQALWTHCLVEGFSAAQAHDLLARLVTADPNHCAAHYQLALCRERAGDLGEALKLAQQCSALNSTSLLIEGMCGRLELLAGGTAKAAERLSRLWRETAKVVEAREKPRASLPPLPESAHALTPTIYIPVEISGRELSSRLLIALFAARAGFSVVVAGHTVLRRAKGLPRGIVLNKSLHAMDDVLVAEARARGHVLCVIDEEAFGWTGGLYSLLRTLDLTLLHSCSALFGPGRYYVDEIRAQAPDAPLVAAGNPRTDFYDPRLAPLVADDVRSTRQRQGRSIVLCTNFGGWNSRTHAHSTVCSIALRASGADMAGPRGTWLRNIYEDSAAVECRNTAAVIEAIPALVRAFPEHKIVLRPHPGENTEAWERILAGVPEVLVSRAESLHAQMLASDLLIHLAGCGTGLEAQLAGRPTVCLNPVAEFAYPRLGISTQLSRNAHSTEELIQVVKEELESGAPPLSPAQRDLLALTLERPDQLASAMIADHMATLFTRMTGAAPRDKSAARADVHELRTHFSTAKAKADAAAFGNVGLRAKALTVSAEEIKNTLMRMTSCLELDGECEVRTLTEGVFFIRGRY